VTGKASDMVGVWIAPVTAQVMMTLSDFAGIVLSRSVGSLSCAGLIRASISFAKRTLTKNDGLPGQARQ
jgi:hypothetical protein